MRFFGASDEAKKLRVMREQIDAAIDRFKVRIQITPYVDGVIKFLINVLDRYLLPYIHQSSSRT